MRVGGVIQRRKRIRAVGGESEGVVIEVASSKDVKSRWFERCVE